MLGDDADSIITKQTLFCDVWEHFYNFLFYDVFIMIKKNSITSPSYRVFPAPLNSPQMRHHLIRHYQVEPHRLVCMQKDRVNDGYCASQGPGITRDHHLNIPTCRRPEQKAR